MADQDSAGVIEASLDTTAPDASRQVDVMRNGQNALASGQGASPPMSPVRSGEVLPPRRRRRIILPLIALAAAGYGLHTFSNYYSVGRFLVTTDDAYVKADMSIIAAKVPGYLASVPVAENAFVHAGDILATIDPGDYQLAVDGAIAKIATQDATIDRIGRQVLAQDALIAQAKAQILATDAQLVSTKADNVRALAEYDRANKLVASSFGTPQRAELALADRDRSNAAVASAQATGAAAKAALAATQANQQVIASEKIEAQKVRGELVATLEKAKHDLSFTQIRAPFDGVVGNRAAAPGQYVATGTRLLALVPFSSVYVEANFKETQLGKLKPGQKVDLTVDSVSGRKFEGVVESIAPASGAQFSLLPPENATGNFTKIVQRIPVHIRVPAEVATSGLLRPGLSVVVDVRTRDDSAPAPTLLGALGLTRETGK